ncbi:5-dehydro-2-deoxygluconokinase [Kocuria sp. JC486]|uniref:5-dehydro-2-deoxygluconokinase n=1 Tax=Kocuria soli TaxID=2485125 RepID=A0A3N4A102_9MICC|nr:MULTISPECIES: 5-dehydro-2-deoxygluconokinase [Kocuria]NHU85969.1 5-dehydro-2-deoxygluconokinase [Kocuria sp. JC486]ROZ65764.1 5-dehydro-2-deoxygluconokinase [Kocuria soli]
MTHDLVTMGRISVDVYPQDIGVGLEDVQTFGKYLGGSPTNVAVAAARHGRNTAVITRTGPDPFGDYLRSELERYGVDPRWATAVEGLQTPVTFCAIRPPEDFPLYFYGRTPTAPDWAIEPGELDLAGIRDATLFWSTVTGLAQEPSRSAQIAAHEARPRESLAPGQHTILDLDHRPMFWDSEEHAREEVARILPYVTVAIGNETECAVAVGHGSPDAQADRLLEAGVQIAVVKLGSQGVMAATPEERVVSAPLPVETVNGLGAGDSFGGAFCHGLLAGWPLEQTLDFANACGAIVASRLACSEDMPTTQEALELLRERGRDVPGQTARTRNA